MDRSATADCLNRRSGIVPAEKVEASDLVKSDNAVSSRNYYDILGIESNATAKEIRAAHRALVRQLHPDTAENGIGDPQRFSQVQEAYDVLSNADQRRKYDARQAQRRGDIPASARRHPPKVACDVCGAPVFASQRQLYLGRYMCVGCYDSRSRRTEPKLRFLTWAELRWQIKKLRVWIMMHWAILVLLGVALTAVGGRVFWLVSRAHRHADSTARQSSGRVDAITVSSPYGMPNFVPRLPPIDTSPQASGRE